MVFQRAAATLRRIATRCIGGENRLPQSGVRRGRTNCHKILSIWTGKCLEGITHGFSKALFDLQRCHSR